MNYNKKIKRLYKVVDEIYDIVRIEAKKELSDELIPYLDLGYKEKAMKIIKHHLSKRERNE